MEMSGKKGEWKRKQREKESKDLKNRRVGERERGRERDNRGRESKK